MENLIAALQIIMKFMNKNDYSYKYPLSIGYELLFIAHVNINEMSLADIDKLASLGWYPGDPNSNPDDFDIDELTEESWIEVREELEHCIHYYI